MRLLRKFVIYSFSLFLPIVAAADVTITRDSFGVPTISGGNLKEVSRAVGYVHAQDRLWQIFLQNIAANGRLAQYLGLGTGNIYLDSDVFQREINPTNKEVKEEIEKFFTDEALTAFTYYVKGLNDWVDEVNGNAALKPFELSAILGSDPVPHFTLYDNLRSVRLFLQSFSPTQIPQFQLQNLMALQTLTGTFGPTAGYAIFEDVDPTTGQIRSDVTIIHNRNATPMSIPFTTDALFSMLNKATEEALCGFKNKGLFLCKGDVFPDVSDTADRIKRIKDLHKTMVPSIGSNGQVIGPHKSDSGNPLLRCAIQPNFNHPSDFYQVKVDDSFFTGNYFIVPGIPFGIGMYNQFGFTVQTGHLPTNDFLFEPIANISSSRKEVIKVKGKPDVIIKVYRSSSGGWVIENPINGLILTLRSAFIERQLQGLNIIGDLPFINSVPEFFRRALKFDHSSDIVGFEGQCADCEGNFGAFQATDWTQLPDIYDRRLPQGVIFPAPLNQIYELSASARKPMYDINNPQGYYSGWNNPFKQFAAGSADTVTGLPLSRAYWLEDYFQTFSKISFDDLKQTTFRQAVANSVVAFKDSRPTAFADLFTPLFKDRFFQAILNQISPTTDQLMALSLLSSFEGNWFDGTEADAFADGSGTNDVSDKFILASAWLLNVAAEILNPFLTGTYFEVDPGTSGGALNALPTLNAFGASNDLATYQGNLLARILGTSTDNSLFFPNWLASVNVDQKIIDGLNTALTNLGGFGAQPWGHNLRGTYFFNNAILGPVAQTKMFNASGLYFVTEFGPEGIIRLETVLPLGESGFVKPNGMLGPNNLDQLPRWQTFQLISN